VTRRGGLRPDNVTLLLGVLTVVALLLPASPLAQATILLGMPTLLGAWVLRFLGAATLGLAARVPLTLASGLLGLLLLGFATGYFLPMLGIAGTLDGNISKGIWIVTAVAATVPAVKLALDPVAEVLQGLHRRTLGWLAILAAPPLLALFGVARLNAHGSAAPAVLAGVVAIALTGAAVALPDRPWLPPRVALLGSAILTMVWQQPLRGQWLAGADIQHEYYVVSLTIRHGVFPLGNYRNPYGGMLSLTTWPAQVHAATGMSPRVILGLLPGFCVVIAVGLMWGALRDRLSARATAAVLGLFTVGSAALLRELPSITRQCYSLVFFAALLLAVGTTSMSPRAARLVAAGAGVGMAVTHYSTAYLAATTVAVGFLATVIARSPKPTRILTAPVTAIVVGAAYLWGGVVAHTGSNFTALYQSISRQGLQLLPGSGNFLSRWLKGAAIYQSVPGTVVHQIDLGLRRTIYANLHVDPGATAVPILNVPGVHGSGLPVLGPLLAALGALAAQGVVLLVLVAVFGALVLASRHRQYAAIAGMALSALVISAVSRTSQTLAVQFGPARVQLEMYLLFAVAASVVLPHLATWPPLRRVLTWRPSMPNAVFVACGVGAMALMLAASQLGGVLVPGSGAVLTYSARGGQADWFPQLSDLDAAEWMASVHFRGVLQTDYLGRYSLEDVGDDRPPGIANTLDPVLVDSHSWLYTVAAANNLGVLAGGTNVYVGLFQYGPPRKYFAIQRPVLYASSSDVIFGVSQVPGVPYYRHHHVR